jgi:hypothetical protein
MIERFGKDAATVKVLLEFLKSWIEEAMNPHVRLAVSHFYRFRQREEHR